MTSDPTVAVVIPYFQEEAGILSHSIQSALAQVGVPAFPIYVVDDGSPRPANTELAELIIRYPNRIFVIDQENAGPGAARNSGLNAIPHGTRYVAFLDSDDQWTVDHLARGLAALETGYDFYFSDFRFSDFKELTAFERNKRICLAQHHQILGLTYTYEYVGDLFDQTMRGNIIGTPTVVYRYESFPALRFREEFFNGQDYFFWLDISRLTKKIAFSAQVECDCGKGLNIYSGAGWGTERSMERLLNEIKLWKSVAREFGLDAQQRRHNNTRLSALNVSLARDLLYRLHNSKTIPFAKLRSHFSVDRLFPIRLLVNSLRIAQEKLRV